MKIILIGASGTIGSAVGKLLEAKNHEVLSASRKGAFRVNIEDASSVARLFAKTGSVDAVISTAGDAPYGDLRELTDEQWSRALNSKLMGQINLVRHGLGNTTKGFVLTGGSLAYSPWPHTSAIAVANAGIEGFVKGAAADLRHEKQVLVVHPPLLAETAKFLGMDPAKFPDAHTVAHAYIDALESDETGRAFFVDGYHPRK